ncbi:MAG: glycogen synthase [Clostridia bacterium]|nr:glycogen synthase [Clostridia bacterium]
MDLAKDKEPNINKHNTVKKKILFVASESQPFCGTGGLADIICGLPRFVKKEEPEYDIRVILPYHEIILPEYKKKLEYIGNKIVELAWRHEYCGVFRCVDENITYYFIDNEKYFKRERPYGYNDDAERFAFFSKAVLDVFDITGFVPDIIHTNDWQSALVSVYLKTNYSGDPRYSHIKTVLNLHNLQYQGRYGISVLTDVLGIDAKYRSLLEHQNDVNFLKAGIITADRLVTVSPSYAEEIKTSESGCGLNDIIRANAHKLRGILNGLDYKFYNPKTDKDISNNFDLETLENRKKNKEDLQKEYGLNIDPNAPMVCIVTRMARQKGIDLIKGCMEKFIIEDNVQFVGVGEGEYEYHNYFNYLNNKFPRQCHVNIGYSLEIGKKLYSASDIFIMPSMVEPCGLSQMVASRYGCVPIVRETGGLKDSIKDFGCVNGGNGYTFARYSIEDLQNSIKRALYDYKADKKAWEEKVKICMSTDFSWNKSIQGYIDIYKGL